MADQCNKKFLVDIVKTRLIFKYTHTYENKSDSHDCCVFLPAVAQITDGNHESRRCSFYKYRPKKYSTMFACMHSTSVSELKNRRNSLFWLLKEKHYFFKFALTEAKDRDRFDAALVDILCET